MIKNSKILDDRDYTMREVAAFTRISIYTIRNYVQSGKIKAGKKFGKWVINGKILKEFLELR